MSTVQAPKGAETGRSASAVRLAPPDCRAAGSGVIPTAACAPNEFPWVSSPAVHHEELLARGATEVAQATFTISGRPVLHETVLQGAAGRTLLDMYVAHAKRCGATTLAKSNGQAVLVSRGGRSGLLMGVTDDHRLIALQAMDGRTPDQLVGLMEHAMAAAG